MRAVQFIRSVIIVAVYATNAVLCLKSANSLPKCYPGDTDCIRNSLNGMLHDDPNGYEFGKFDPLILQFLSLTPETGLPVSVDASIDNAELNGAQTCSIYNVTGFTDDITGSNEIHLRANLLTVRGRYKIKGKVLVLTLAGEGDAIITITNPIIKFKFSGKPKIVDGKTYMQTDDNYNVSFDVDEVTFSLGNLNSNSLLGISANLVINQSSKLIYNTIKPGLIKTFEKETRRIADEAMMKLPFDEFFLKEKLK